MVKKLGNLIIMKMKVKISYRKSRKRKQENLRSKQQTKFFELVNRTSMVSAVQGNVCELLSASRLICDLS